MFAEWQRLQYTEDPPEADYAAALANGAASPGDCLLYWTSVKLEEARKTAAGEHRQPFVVLPQVAQRVISLHASAQAPPCSPLCLERYKQAGPNARLLERVNMMAFLSCNAALRNDSLAAVSEFEKDEVVESFE